ncbi:unnamed protein product [Brassicogethes aeneus]|uniref:Uncharacterized protein n=1 Tax=Brassicogethes aeneus TaxID=1431903 RepID=A0A9P0FMX5_BRAAE|nr:unnamed protein product [Brassicogethes aeneus]
MKTKKDKYRKPNKGDFKTASEGGRRETRSVTLFHINARSLKYKINELEAFLADKNIDIVCVTEYRFKEDEVLQMQLSGKKFVCHHSAFMKVPAKANRKGLSKNANCHASILIVVKLDTVNTRKKDPFIKGLNRLQAVITIDTLHSHTLETAETLRFLQAPSETQDLFFEYFNDRMTISEGKKYHENLYEFEPDKEMILANGSKNPTYSTVQNWYHAWRTTNLGPRTGKGLLDGIEGKFCKHQCAIYKFFEVKTQYFPPITTEDRYNIAKLALGEQAPPVSFYEPFILENHCKTNSSSHSNVQSSSNSYNNNNNSPCSFFEDNHLVDPVRTTSISQDENGTTSIEDICNIIKTFHKSFGSSSNGLRILNDRLKAIKSEGQWESFLHTAGNSVPLRRRNATIKVQPTSISRRAAGVTRESKRLPSGRKFKDEKVIKKRKRNLAQNIKLNKPNALSHGYNH